MFFHRDIDFRLRSYTYFLTSATNVSKKLQTLWSLGLFLLILHPNIT